MSAFNFIPLELEGSYLIEYFSTSDNRGGFSKFFEKNIYKEAGIEFSLNECFISASCKNVIRGLHFQSENPQSKIVSVPKGKVYDVIVDLRKDSPTFKKWIGIELSSENHKAIYVPQGFAHGFASLEEETLMMYQCDGAYDPVSDTGIRYDDSDLNILWPVDENVAIHSERDLQLQTFKTWMEDVNSEWATYEEMLNGKNL